MNNAKVMKDFIIRTSYNSYKNFPPCNMDICICMVNLNLRDSYSDRHHYKNCYERNSKYTSIFGAPIHKTFEYSSDEVI